MREKDKRAERYMEFFYRNTPHLSGEFCWFVVPGFGRDPAEDDAGQAWDSADASDEADEVEVLDAYRYSRTFAEGALRIVELLPETARDSAAVDFLSNVMIIPAAIAAGSLIGNDLDELGGNIACCKRALASANLAIGALREMKEKQIVGGSTYASLVRDAVEVRDLIAIHILDLREKFRLGV